MNWQRFAVDQWCATASIRGGVVDGCRLVFRRAAPTVRLTRVLAALAALAVIAGAGIPLQAVARAAATATPAPAPEASCGWNAPGQNPFMGDVVAAVDAYQDIPAATRARLQQRMASRAYDEVVRIRRDSIDGRRAYRSEIRDMHFGSGQRCATVDRSGWSAQAEERGLVYCEAGHCILVPTVCRNVSRIRVADGAAGAGDVGGGGGGGAHAEAAPVPSAAGGSAGVAAGPGTAPEPGTALALAVPADAADTAALPFSQVADPAAPAANSAEPVGYWWESPPGFTAMPALALDGVDRWPTDVPVVSGLLRSPLIAAPLPAAPVPEPATMLMLLGGLLVFAACRRRVSRA